jgi:hypothetical protein
LSYRHPDDVGPSHNARGFFIGGPQLVTPSDVLARMITEAQLPCAEPRQAPDPREQRRQMVVYRGREAFRRRYRPHGRAEFWFKLTG